MQLKSLETYFLRNIDHFKINPSPHFNLIYGVNGSGKTSVLEAIHLLGMGRSFRTANFRKIIKNDQLKFTVHAIVEQGDDVNPVSLGIEKDLSGTNRLRVANQEASVAEVARLLPIQIINYDSFDLLAAHSKIRRQFFDWGMFHVKHKFLEVWRHFNLALQHRNKALLNKLDREQLDAWNEQFILHAQSVNEYRLEVFHIYLKYVEDLLADFDLSNIKIELNSGWDSNKNLGDLLQESFFKDSLNGYTQYGPHRADIIIKHNSQYAKDILSRGQQKLLISVLKLAQLMMLKGELNKRSVVLIDDLPAELDSLNLEKILRYLQKIETQSFITAIEVNAIHPLIKNCQHKMFHVKHGELIENS